MLPLGGTFADFYRAELTGQVRRAALMTGSSDIAHDVVHEAFVEILRRWDDLDHPGPYLNRAVLNGCRDHARMQHRRRGSPLSAVPGEASAWDPEPIADLLDELPFTQRPVVVLRFYVGLSNLDIAETLGCPTRFRRTVARPSPQTTQEGTPMTPTLDDDLATYLHNEADRVAVRDTLDDVENGTTHVAFVATASRRSPC